MFCKSPYDPCHFPKQFLNFQRGITQAYEVLGLGYISVDVSYAYSAWLSVIL